MNTRTTVRKRMGLALIVSLVLTILLVQQLPANASTLSHHGSKPYRFTKGSWVETIHVMINQSDLSGDFEALIDWGYPEHENEAHDDFLGTIQLFRNKARVQNVPFNSWVGPGPGHRSSNWDSPPCPGTFVYQAKVLRWRTEWDDGGVIGPVTLTSFNYTVVCK